MIILQYPTELAPAAAIVHHAVAPDILDHHEGKLRGESRRLKLLEHAHQRNAHRPDTGMPKPPKQLCPAEGKRRPFRSRVISFSSGSVIMKTGRASCRERVC